MMSTIEQVELNEDIYANYGDETQRQDDLDEGRVDPDLQGGITTQTCNQRESDKSKFTRGDPREVKCYRVAVVGLGPLCVLLLVIIIRLATEHITDTQRLESEIKQLKLNNNDLTQQLQANITNLTQEKDNMTKCVLAQDNDEATITILTQEKDQLQTKNTILTQEKDQLQTKNTILTQGKDQLQTKNNILTQEKDQLQTKNNILTQEKDQLQTKNNILTQENDQLQSTITRLNKLLSSLGESKCFGSSHYYISSDERNWADSKQHCVDLGGHLVIIDSQEEQEFIHTQIKSIYAETRAWIGLSDLETEGVWKWVDGKRLYKSGFWKQGEPNDDHGDEDCVEMLYLQDKPLETWNDAACRMVKNFICEIKLT